MENQYCYKYPRPALTTDQVIFGFGEGELRVLLIRRGNEPFKGKWALPGGFMDMDEDAETCARRELEEETGLKVVNFEQLYAFSALSACRRGDPDAAGAVGPDALAGPGADACV